MSSAKSSFPFIVATVVAGLAFGLVWVYLGQKKSTGTEADQEEVQSEILQEETEGSFDAAPAENPDSSARHSGGLAQDDEQRAAAGAFEDEAERALGHDLAKHVKSFFEVPEKTAEGKFVIKPQPVIWSESCTKHPERKSFSDLTEHVRKEFTLPDELFAPVQSKIKVMHVNQFYTDPQTGLFVQLSLVQGGDPMLGTGYRIEKYSSLDVYMNEVQGNEVLFPLSKRFDLTYADALQKFLEIYQALEKQSMIIGTRGLVYGKEIPPGEFADTSVELTGGRITGFNTPGISCDGITDQTLCECADDSGGQDAGGFE